MINQQSKNQGNIWLTTKWYWLASDWSLTSSSCLWLAGSSFTPWRKKPGHNQGVGGRPEEELETWSQPLIGQMPHTLASHWLRPRGQGSDEGTMWHIAGCYKSLSAKLLSISQINSLQHSNDICRCITTLIANDPMLINWHLFSHFSEADPDVRWEGSWHSPCHAIISWSPSPPAHFLSPMDGSDFRFHPQLIISDRSDSGWYDCYNFNAANSD